MLKEATPEASVVAGDVTVMLPVEADNEMLTPDDATEFPNWSWSWTLTAGLIAAPANALLGAWVNASCFAVAALTTKELLTALVKLVAVAVSV